MFCPILSVISSVHIRFLKMDLISMQYPFQCTQRTAHTLTKALILRTSEDVRALTTKGFASTLLSRRECRGDY